MIKIKIEKNRYNYPIFKMGINEEAVKDNPMLKRALIEAVKFKGVYNYKIPMRYFIPVFNNLSKEHIELHKESILSFLEFSDEYDETYYYSSIATPSYMKKWRENGCPRIFKICINAEDLSLNKEVAFEKINCSIC